MPTIVTPVHTSMKMQRGVMVVELLDTVIEDSSDQIMLTFELISELDDLCHCKNPKMLLDFNRVIRFQENFPERLERVAKRIKAREGKLRLCKVKPDLLSAFTCNPHFHLDLKIQGDIERSLDLFRFP